MRISFHACEHESGVKLRVSHAKFVSLGMSILMPKPNNSLSLQQMYTDSLLVRHPTRLFGVGILWRRFKKE